eukprot:scaffold69678_cov42-Prasinocladus_malaysianus.AAC.2
MESERMRHSYWKATLKVWQQSHVRSCSGDWQKRGARLPTLHVRLLSSFLSAPAVLVRAKFATCMVLPLTMNSCQARPLRVGVVPGRPNVARSISSRQDAHPSCFSRHVAKSFRQITTRHTRHMSLKVRSQTESAEAMAGDVSLNLNCEFVFQTGAAEPFVMLSLERTFARVYRNWLFKP